MSSSDNNEEPTWLEEIHGERALEWVQEQNQASQQALTQNALFERLHEEAKAIFLAPDRVPWSNFAYGYFWNFWTDAKNKQGLWRRTTYDEYLKADPQWETLLDVDALCAQENVKWVYKGKSRMDRDRSTRVLLRLSNGGSDAAVVREYDLERKAFVTGEASFTIPFAAKTDVKPLNENEVLVATDFSRASSSFSSSPSFDFCFATPRSAEEGNSTVTDSGYARQVRLWKRGTLLSEAKLLFEAERSDICGSARVLREHLDRQHVLFCRSLDFYNTHYSLWLADGTLRRLPIPPTSEVLAIKSGWLYLQLKRPEGEFATDSVLRMPLEAEDMARAELVFALRPFQSLEAVHVRNDGSLFVEILHHITSRIFRVCKENGPSGAWTVEALPLPKTGILSLGLRSEEDATDFSVVTYIDHLTPQTQYRLCDEDEWLEQKESERRQLWSLHPLKKGVERFEGARFQTVQRFATSKDGTRVPYFLLSSKSLELHGRNPTLLYGYGGFEISLTPSYESVTGKLWLERGGVYVVANIRGGSEYGSVWHQAALKQNRQCAYDDFIAVAEDLVRTGVTSPDHLGIKGGSNGGLLVGAVLVQRPDLFGAAVMSVGLLDMLKYHLWLAGTSWSGEYGSPDVPEEREFLRRISPFHNVQPASEVRYCRTLLTTSTKDDRVSPVHSRKMVHRLQALGQAALYFEKVDGGHGGASNNVERAYNAALVFTYLFQQLAPNIA